MGDGSMMDRLKRNKMAVGGTLVALVVLVGAWLLGSDAYEERLDAILADTENLRQVELKHLELFGEFIGANAAPRTPDQVSPEPVSWNSNPGFNELSWAPAHTDEVWASFSVTLEGDGFLVRANCDLDGDGEMARFEASHNQPARRVSERGVR